jgi:Skp family chaperone for outer membrane proteins
MPKYALTALVLSMLLPSIAAAQAAQSMTPDAARLAYFSPQRAFFQSNDGKAAEARLTSLQAQASREADSRNAKLKALQDELAQRSSVLAEGARREREEEIDRVQLDLKHFMEDAQAEFLGVQRNLENAFLAKLAPAVDTIAKKRGLLFVLNQDSGVLAWADPRLDITADVIAAVNQPTK